MSIISIHPYGNHFGFFSCCSIKLNDIVTFINSNLKTPNTVDSFNLFMLYKKNFNEDITYDFFEHYNNTKHNEIKYPINYHHSHQFHDYSNIDYKHIIPLIEKYFSPSNNITNKINHLIQKYNIDYENTLAIYYRGTDKSKETQIASFDEYYNQINQIIKQNKSINILVQTDTSQFVDYINNKNLKNIIIVNENHTSYSNKGIHYEKSPTDNYNEMFNLFSTFLIIAKCKYIICGSGNCSIWMMLYRGNNKNVIQYLNGKWCNNISEH